MSAVWAEAEAACAGCGSSPALTERTLHCTMAATERAEMRAGSDEDGTGFPGVTRWVGSLVERCVFDEAFVKWLLGGVRG